MLKGAGTCWTPDPFQQQLKRGGLFQYMAGEPITRAPAKTPGKGREGVAQGLKRGLVGLWVALLKLLGLCVPLRVGVGDFVADNEGEVVRLIGKVAVREDSIDEVGLGDEVGDWDTDRDAGWLAERVKVSMKVSVWVKVRGVEADKLGVSACVGLWVGVWL